MHYNSHILLSVFFCVIAGNDIDCVDDIDVQKQGNSGMGSSRQMIVPQAYFYCSGRINGFMVSLNQDDEDDVGYPYIQVWRQLNSDTYTLVGQYQLQRNDISRRQDYHLANITLSGTNRIEFQPNDTIGYYHPSRPPYRVYNIENIRGYTIYSVITHVPLPMMSDH